MAINMKSVDSYTKNLIKSFGYISADVFKSYAPTLSSLAKSTKEATESSYQAIKDFTSKSSTSNFSFNGIKDKGKEIASNVWKNTIDDLKSGKIYNKERSDALDNEMMKSMGLDFDFDFDFDDDWGDDEITEEDSTKAQVAAQMEGSKAIINAVDAMGRGLSASMTETTIESASYIANSAREDSKALFEINKAGYASINKALMNVNETIYEFSKIGEPLTAHMQNSTQFFGVAQKSLINIEQTLKQIEKNTKPVSPAGKSSSSSDKSINNFFTDEGIDFGGIKEFIGDQVKEYKELVDMFAGFMGVKSITGGAKHNSLAPLMGNWAIQALIPKDIKESLKSLDKSVKYGLQAGLSKLASGGSNNELINILSSLFLPQRETKKSISTKSFDRGPVAWDGVARKALTDVIPTTLLEIYAVLAGAPSMRYNYETGKYITTKSIASSFKENKRRYAKEAGGDLYESIEERVGKNTNINDKRKQEVINEVNKYFDKAFESGNYEIFSTDNGIDKAVYEMIKEYTRDKIAPGNRKDGYILNKTRVQADQAAADYADYLRRIEAEGNSIYTHLYDDFKTGNKSSLRPGGIIGLDAYGHDIYFYLQGIWQYTYSMAANGVGNNPAAIYRSINPKTRTLPEIPMNKVSTGEPTTEEANRHTFGYYFDDEVPEEETETDEEKNKNKKKSAKERLQEWFKAHVSEKSRNIINKIFGTEITTEQFTIVGMMDSISNSINRLLFGNEDDPKKGLMGYMFEKTKDMFDNFKDYFKENFGDKLKDFFQEHFVEPMKGSSWWQETKNKFKSMKDSVKGSFRKVFFGDDGSENAEAQGPVDNGQAAYGRKITKSGIITVSEGELVIPSEYNPFYHGLNNKSVQLAREKRISKGLFPSYVDGGDTATGETFKEMDWGTLEEMDWDTLNSNYKKSFGRKKLRDKIKSENSILGILFAAADGIFDKAREITNDIFDKDKIEKDKEKFSDKLKDVMGDIGKAKGDIGAGGIIGGIGSALIGVNPIFGAFMGAGIGFMYKSKKFQDFLFGPEDENGERKHQKAYDFMMKKVPAIGKGAGIGATAGILMGSPVLGAFIGGATGFLITNEKFQDYIFGEKDENGNRSGGILVDKIFGNIDNTFHNIGNRLNRWLKDLGRGLKNKFTGLIDYFKKKAEDPDAGFFSKLIGGTLNLGEKVVKAPFSIANKVTGFIDEKVAKGNLKGGYSTYNKNWKRNMTAYERIQSRDKFNLNKGKAAYFNSFDNYLASLENAKGLEDYKELIDRIKTEPDGSNEQQAAINSLLGNDKLKEFTKGLSADKLSKFLKENASKLGDLAEDESKRKGMSKEDLEEQREEEKLSLLDRISILVESLVTKRNPEDIAPGKFKKTPEPEEDKNSEQIEEDEETTTVFDAFGNPHKYVKDGKGIKEDNGDKATADSKGKIREFIDSVMEGPKRIAFNISTTLFGDGVHSDGLIGGPIKKIKGFFSKLVNKILKPIANIALVGAGFYALFKSLFGNKNSLFNRALNKLGKIFGFGGADEETNDVKTTFVDDQGNPVTQNEKGEYVNDKGQVVDPSHVQTVRAGKDTFLSKLRKTTLRQVVLRKPTMVGFLGKKMVTGNKYTNKIAQLASDKLLTDENAYKLGIKLKEFFDKLLKHLDDILEHLPIDDATKVGLKKKLPGCFQELAEKIAKSPKIGAVKGAIKNFEDIVPVLNIIAAVSDFVTGYEDARTTLGITEEPSKPQRIIAGLLRLIKNFIPIVGPFIPDDLIINVLCKGLGGMFKGLVEQRDRAKAEVEQYNAEHGTNYDVGEYNKAVLNDYTFTERMGNVFKTAWNQTKDKFSAAKAAYAEEGIGGFFNKLLGVDSIVGAYNSAGGGIKGIWEGMVEAANQIPGNDCGVKMLRLFQYAFTGDTKFFDPNNSVMEAFQDSKAENGVKSSIFSKYIGGLPLQTIKMTLTPVALLTSGVRTAFTKVKNLIGGEDVVKDYSALKQYREKLDQYAANSQFKDILAEKLEANSKLSGVFKFAGMFFKFVNIFKAGIKWVIGGFESLVGTLKEAVYNSTIGKVYNTVDYVKDTAEYTKENGWWAGTKKVFSDAWNATKEKLFGKGSGLAVNSDSSCNNCGFQSQLDPRYKDISFGGSTVGDAGCAPAVGKMISATMGGSMDMDTAINKAKPYTNNNGTSAKYFEDTFNASPLKNTSTVKSALESGRPVILLGKDSSNKDKNKSPFGPDNHYVLATGMKNGKVLVNDPESNGPKVYDQSILNKSSYNLTYGGRSRRRGKGGFSDTTDAQQIWAYLTGTLGFSEAGAAGLMGCWAEESMNNPNTIEGFYLSNYPGDEAVRTTKGLNDYTTNILFPAYGGGIDQEAYKGTDGNYYPGFGLAQWTGTRGQALHEYSKTSGSDWYTLDNQLKYLSYEMSNSYSDTAAKLRSATDVAQATNDAMRGFEGNTSSEYYGRRLPYANEIYSTYSGKKFTYNGNANGTAKASNSTSDTSSSNSDSSSSESSSSDGLFSKLSSIFGSLTNIFNLKDGFSMNDSSSGNSSSTSNSNKTSTNKSNGGVTNAKGAAAAAQAAENELGYAESGDNITKFGAWSGCDGQPWCAAFSAWAIAQAFDGQNSSARKALYDCENINYCPTLVSSFKNNNAWYDEPEVGDEVLYSKNGDDAYHVGLVTAVDKDAKTFVSVEGNTNDQVTRKEHSSYKDGTVYGFGRPDYTGANATVTSNGNNGGNTISGDADYSATGSGLRGGSSGILRKAAPSRFAYGSMKGKTLKYGKASGLISKNRFSGSNSEIKNKVTTTLSNFRTSIKNGNTGGGIDPALVADLLSSITSLLDSIANNTAPTEKIYNALVEYIEYAKGNKGTTTSSSNQKMEMPKDTTDVVDSNLAGLVSTLAAIARG